LKKSAIGIIIIIISVILLSGCVSKGDTSTQNEKSSGSIKLPEINSSQNHTPSPTDYTSTSSAHNPKPTTSTCPVCGGSGWIPCSACEGSGFINGTECPVCGGTGGHACQNCGGDGIIGN
jgi:DnaJ-class molecular chaperone